MSFTAQQIHEIVSTLLELKTKKTKPEIDAMPEFADFKKANTLLYETVLSQSNFQPEIFLHMLYMKQQLEQGADPYAVDVQVGKYMAAKYVDPVVAKLPPKDS